MSTALAAWIGVAFVGGGTVGAALAGVAIDKWRSYRLVISIGAAGSLVGAFFVLFFVFVCCC